MSPAELRALSRLPAGPGHVSGANGGPVARVSGFGSPAFVLSPLGEGAGADVRRIRRLGSDAIPMTMPQQPTRAGYHSLMPVKHASILIQGASVRSLERSST